MTTDSETILNNMARFCCVNCSNLFYASSLKNFCSDRCATILWIQGEKEIDNLKTKFKKAIRLLKKCEDESFKIVGDFKAEIREFIKENEQ